MTPELSTSEEILTRSYTMKQPKCPRKHQDGRICGEPVRFVNTELCEDCWAEAQDRFHGRPQRVGLEQPGIIRFDDEEITHHIRCWQGI